MWDGKYFSYKHHTHTHIHKKKNTFLHINPDQKTHSLEYIEMTRKVKCLGIENVLLFVFVLVDATLLYSFVLFIFWFCSSSFPFSQTVNKNF